MRSEAAAHALSCSLDREPGKDDGSASRSRWHLPFWLIGLSLVVGAVLLALLVYWLAAWLLKRAFGTRLPLIGVFIDRTAGPARLALCLAAVALVMPLAPLGGTIRTPLTHLFVSPLSD